MNTNTNTCNIIIKYKCVGHNYVEKISHNIRFSMSAHSICTGNSSKIKTSPLKRQLKRILLHYETEEMGFSGEPIWVRTLSSHCRGPWRWISIQHGVLVTSCRWYSAPQPLTKLIRMVHILVSSYTASKPWLTDWARSWANSWLLKILRLQLLGILQTVVGWKPWWKLQFLLWTKMLLSLRHSAYTSPPT